MGHMIKDKLEKYQYENHINGYDDMIKDDIHTDYTRSLVKVKNIKFLLMDKIENLYQNYVRQDPFRPLYNY